MAQKLHLTIEPSRLHVLVYPAPDLKGQWIAHCLELDLISQGDSREHAREMFEDAFRIVVNYNLEHDLVPVQYQLAPREIWEAANIPMPESLEEVRVASSPSA